MKEFDFYDYNEEKDSIKIYSEDLHDFFEKHFGLIIESVDFDKNYNVVLYIEYHKKLNSNQIEKYLLDKVEHLNDIEIKEMKIVLTFDCKEIELS